MAAFIFVRNATHPLQDLPRIRLCDSFVCRLRGLMFRASLPPDEGLLLEVARDSRIDSSIHMLFVPFDLAVVWINSRMQVVDKIIAKPWHPAYFPAAPARYTLEIHPLRFDSYVLEDQVEFENA